jgi:hypothetical protein
LDLKRKDEVLKAQIAPFRADFSAEDVRIERIVSQP